MKNVDVITKSKVRCVSLGFFMAYDKNKLKLVGATLFESGIGAS
ncbi:hypothetical protein [Priestia megaterium]|nr:hypothetical protein [Priestia megaterium]MDH2363995.1 hypothetical protein [Priestia megaterium]